MDTFGYRFLRLNSQTLALVEVHLDSNIPEVCQEVYLDPPYLDEKRLKVVKDVYGQEGLEEWRESCTFGFNLAISLAKFYPIIDYTDKLQTKDRELILWGILDPLTYWDEFIPLFDNEFKLILR